MSSLTFKQAIQQPVLSGIIEMFHVDLTPIGFDQHFRWVPSINPDNTGRDRDWETRS